VQKTIRIKNRFTIGASLHRALDRVGRDDMIVTVLGESRPVRQGWRLKLSPTAISTPKCRVRRTARQNILPGLFLTMTWGATYSLLAGSEKSERTGGNWGSQGQYRNGRRIEIILPAIGKDVWRCNLY
jgi:hypothetical protein